MKFIELETCESTNDEAMSHSAKPVVVSTLRQTRGRGRLGHRWEDSNVNQTSANVFVSIALDAPTLAAAVKQPGWIPLLAGVACINALQECVLESGLMLDSPSRLRLKWPNDIYYDQAKLGGILCESKIKGDKLSTLVIGLGLNLVSAPKLDELQTASVFQDVFPDTLVDTEMFRKSFIEKWARQIMLLVKTLAQGKTSVIADYWKSYAKLELYSQLSFYESASARNKIMVTALDLDPTGKLKAKRIINGREEVCLIDQADTLA